VTESVDVVVLGLGVGGEDLAGSLAEAGLRVVGIEAELVGGECPYWACIPTKMMVRAAGLLAEARRIPGMAGTATAEPDWAPVARRIRDEATDSWDDRVAVDRFTGKGGIFVRGRGAITAPGQVTVNGVIYEASRGIAVATGSSPSIPPIPGLADLPYWTNRDAVKTEEVPASLLVLGGGAVGLEMAQVFARFGARVTVVEAAEHLLPLEEPEAGASVQGALERDGVEVWTGAKVVGAGRDGELPAVTLEGGQRLSGERLLVATGRRGNVRGIGLEHAGLDPDTRWIEVDERLRAGERVWSIGDVTGKGAFTHVAIYQSRIATADILGRPSPPADYHALPRVTFTDPEVGAAGLTAQAARKQGIRVRTGVAQVSTSARGWIHGPGNDGVIKLVEDADRGVLVGATSMGPSGGEVLSMLTLAIQERIPTEHLRQMIYAYPTFHRGVEDALRGLAAD
jgi:pyruvate/2-oxoglutarate dehydrogenase complex dihydrolipoamide dehydrogenase (E3) component